MIRRHATEPGLRGPPLGARRGWLPRGRRRGVVRLVAGHEVERVVQRGHDAAHDVVRGRLGLVRRRLDGFQFRGAPDVVRLAPRVVRDLDLRERGLLRDGLARQLAGRRAGRGVDVPGVFRRAGRGVDVPGVSRRGVEDVLAARGVDGFRRSSCGHRAADGFRAHRLGAGRGCRRRRHAAKISQRCAELSATADKGGRSAAREHARSEAAGGYHSVLADLEAFHSINGVLSQCCREPVVRECQAAAHKSLECVWADF